MTTLSPLSPAKQAGEGSPSLGDYKKRSDGSANDPKAESDGYATGLMVFGLRQADVPAKDAKVQKGVEWLRCWPSTRAARSRSDPQTNRRLRPLACCAGIAKRKRSRVDGSG